MMDIFGDGDHKPEEEPSIFEMLENMQDRIFGIEESLKYIESAIHRLSDYISKLDNK